VNYKGRALGAEEALIFNMIVEWLQDETETVSVLYLKFAPTLLCRMQGYHLKITLHVELHPHDNGLYLTGGYR
jgi:hypothetical protein